MKPGPLADSPTGRNAPWAGPQVLFFMGMYLFLQILAAQMSMGPIDNGDSDPSQEVVTPANEEPAANEEDPLGEADEEASSTASSTRYLTSDQARPLFSTLSIFNGLLIASMLLYMHFWRKRHPDSPSVLLGAKGTVLSCLKGGFLACLAWIPVHLLLGLIWSGLLMQFGHEPNPQEAVSLFIDSVKDGDHVLLLLLVLQIILIAPWLEELLFRGLLFRWILGYRSVLASTIISGVIFGVLHDSLASMFPIACLGVALAWLYNRTGSLLTTIFFHTFFNATMISILFAVQISGLGG